MPNRSKASALKTKQILTTPSRCCFHMKDNLAFSYTFVIFSYSFPSFLSRLPLVQFESQRFKQPLVLSTLKKTLSHIVYNTCSRIKSGWLKQFCCEWNETLPHATVNIKYPTFFSVMIVGFIHVNILQSCSPLCLKMSVRSIKTKS